MPTSDDGVRFCGVSEHMLEQARQNQYAWRNIRNLKVFLGDRVPGVGANMNEFWAHCKRNFDAIQTVCGLTFERTMDRDDAQICVLTRSIDGTGGTLAEHELPMGNDVTLRGWYDKGDAFTVQNPPPSKNVLWDAVFKHEICHGCGLSHTKTKGALMQAYYTPSVYELTKWEINELKTRYGDPIAPPTPDPVPGGGAGSGGDLTVTVSNGSVVLGSMVIPKLQFTQ